jgi:hypothetical protein
MVQSAPGPRMRSRVFRWPDVLVESRDSVVFVDASMRFEGVPAGCHDEYAKAFRLPLKK